MKIIVTPSLEKECKITEVINQELERRTALIFEGDDIEVSDSYHTMHELYQHRMALNIALFNYLHQTSGWDNFADVMVNIQVMKSKLHNDGTMFEGYFIVMAITPGGQISYHYKLKHWNKFNISEVERTPEYDGHSTKDVLERLMKL